MCKTIIVDGKVVLSGNKKLHLDCVGRKMGLQINKLSHNVDEHRTDVCLFVCVK